MRLGEIKQKIDRVLTPDENTLAITSEPMYGNQAQDISNFGALIEALGVLVNLEWHDVNSEELKEITDIYGVEETVILPIADFNKLSSIVARINVKLPVYYSILETSVDKQDDKIINVKLPESIDKLEDLNKFNEQLETLFKSFKLGEFKFQGFDKGSFWYEILITGTLFHSYFIACLQVAQQYYKAKTAFFESVEAEISYLAAKQSAKDLTKDKFLDNYLDVFLDAKIREVCKEMKDSYGKTEEENVSELVMATEKLVKAIGDGAEFHLSLNPPKYAAEKSGMLTIDYKKIQASNAAKIAETKQAQIGSGDSEEV